MFLENFNGVSYILEVEWMSNVELELIQIVPGVLVKGVLLIYRENWLILNGQKNGLGLIFYEI
jgi:hypothetical protein